MYLGRIMHPRKLALMSTPDRLGSKQPSGVTAALAIMPKQPRPTTAVIKINSHDTLASVGVSKDSSYRTKQR